ncbi:MAG TPA: polyprenyl synthetase family protein [Acidobacteriota bacterium]|nr:polyprenyl synthetase family protein [Acidobacteriota bacterium]HNT17546.1 polyprenyl synthetase family protein [Acidobacteriota bacterium]HPA26858.1 polyprenyl synthetase family protein [Acidobacteriota bacterium]HQO19856.1 polyprenyl synthetase family protein [Acidobacteriota bacterium]HQQ47271.1 polyprenyl synthetase family protein [Acidobacteriota bacterium]
MAGKRTLYVLKDKAEVLSIRNEINQVVGERLKEVEKIIAKRLRSPYIPIAEMGQYLAASAGKRLRPTLVFLASELVGYRGGKDVTYAAILEFIHTATLVHDDIVDQAILRRGKASLHTRWGSESAVLMGDYLLISAVQMATSMEWNEIQPMIAGTAKSLIEGELLQSHRLYDLTITEEEYMEIIELKTARLFSTCVTIPPILKAADRTVVEAMRTYGLSIGMAFQIVDDCLDFMSDEKTLGKPVGQDLKEGKITLPLILLRDTGKPEDREFLEAIVAGRRFDPRTLEELAERVSTGGFVDRALNIAHDFALRADESLSCFEDSKTLQLLAKLPEFILKRSY